MNRRAFLFAPLLALQTTAPIAGDDDSAAFTRAKAKWTDSAMIRKTWIANHRYTKREIGFLNIFGSMTVVAEDSTGSWQKCFDRMAAEEARRQGQ
jgi:hypothetical protein